MGLDDYLGKLRQGLELAHQHRSYTDIEKASGVSNQLLSSFARGAGMRPKSRAALEAWLREHGYWEVEERGTHYLRYGEIAQPEGPEEEPPGMREHAAGYPLVSGAEALARLHDAQAAMWRSGLPTEEKMALEETWLASYVVALQKLGRLPG